MTKGLGSRYGLILINQAMCMVIVTHIIFIKLLNYRKYSKIIFEIKKLDLLLLLSN